MASYIFPMVFKHILRRHACEKVCRMLNVLFFNYMLEISSCPVFTIFHDISCLIMREAILPYVPYFVNIKIPTYLDCLLARLFSKKTSRYCQSPGVVVGGGGVVVGGVVRKL